MKNLSKTLLGAAGFAAMFAGNAYADDAPAAPDYAVSAAVAVQSDYRFRGISQNDRVAAPQATLNATGPEGFYVGTWASKIDWGFNHPSLEVDLYGGKHTDIFGLGDLNTELYYYSYPDAPTKGFAAKNASYLEVINTFTHAFGPVTLDAVWAYSPEFSLGGGTGNYIEGQAAFAVNDWLTISGNVGHQWVQGAKGYLGANFAGDCKTASAIGGCKSDGDYTHADLGATLTYKSLALDLRYVTTDMSAATCSYYMTTPDHPCSGGFVGTLTYNISSFPW